jgi:hypothetical protein
MGAVALAAALQPPAAMPLAAMAALPLHSDIAARLGRA